MKKNYFVPFLLTAFLLFPEFLISQVVINEYSASNLTGYLDNHDKSEDWIELYNSGAESVNLEGYFLSDNPDNPSKWQIPSGISIPAGGYITFWASGRDAVESGNYHTNFKLKQTKANTESVVFTDPSGNIIDQVLLERTQLEHSRGRQPDGSENWKIFTDPTKGNTNNNAQSYSRYAAPVEMSLEAGFYSGSVTVEMTTSEPDAEIRFTINGKEPVNFSPLYSSPVSYSNTLVLKARAFSPDAEVLPGFITFNTYFIDVDHSLPILSVAGNSMKNLLNGNASLKPHGTIEYFKDGERKDYGYGEYNKHGQDSWYYPHRSFDYIARDEMGYHDAFHQKLLELTDREDYQRIIIRACGDDNYPNIDSSAHMRDVFVQKLANKNKMHLDMRRGDRCVVYVDGQFWGVYSIREKVSDADYTKYYYGQDKYHIYYLMLWGDTWAEYGGQGAFNNWNQIRNYILNNNMANPDKFEYVKARYDYKSLVDYVLINSFVVCTDWINWNVGWWRGFDPGGGHQKWGYILWDEDATFNHYINYTNVPDETPYASPCYQEGIYNDPGFHIAILNKLLDNEEFTQYYVARYQDLMNTAFVLDDMLELFEGIENSMIDDMPFQVDRWGGSFNQWQQNVQKVKDFITVRKEVVPEGLNDCYNLTGPYELSFSVEPEGKGSIRFNSLDLDEFPWVGSYHGGMEMKMKALETDLNYVFDHWELNNHELNPGDDVAEVTLSLTQGDEITAVFVPAENPALNIVINEINYNSASNFETGDWVEFYNKGDIAVDVSGWVFKDSDDNHQFVIPDGTVMDADSYLVIARDKDLLMSKFPGISPVLGDMTFGLSGGGELIRLFNNLGTLIDYVEYDDALPWPEEPDGNGPTLELINPDYDNSLPSSWQGSYVAVAPHGTPTALNSVFDVGISEINYGMVEISVYPNPVINDAWIVIPTGSELRNGVIRIYNMQGKEVMFMPVREDRSYLAAESLNAGMYIIKYFDGDILLGTQKLMVE